MAERNTRCHLLSKKNVYFVYLLEYYTLFPLLTYIYKLDVLGNQTNSVLFTKYITEKDNVDNLF
jgi:hypothetical protein